LIANTVHATSDGTAAGGAPVGLIWSIDTDISITLVAADTNILTVAGSGAHLDATWLLQPVTSLTVSVYGSSDGTSTGDSAVSANWETNGDGTGDGTLGNATTVLDTDAANAVAATATWAAHNDVNIVEGVTLSAPISAAWSTDTSVVAGFKLVINPTGKDLLGGAGGATSDEAVTATWATLAVSTYGELLVSPVALSAAWTAETATTKVGMLPSNLFGGIGGGTAGDPLVTDWDLQTPAKAEPNFVVPLSLDWQAEAIQSVNLAYNQRSPESLNWAMQDDYPFESTPLIFRQVSFPRLQGN